MISKQDYIILAKVIRRQPPCKVVELLAEDLCAELLLDNPRFNSGYFLKAAGYEK